MKLQDAAPARLHVEEPLVEGQHAQFLSTALTRASSLAAGPGVCRGAELA